MRALPQLLFLFCSLFSLWTKSAAVDTITVDQAIRDNDTIVSAGEMFELGFFSPGNSKNRYLGIWYKKVSPQTVVWVANRETPLTDTSSVLKVDSKGTLILFSGNNSMIWSSNSSVSFRSTNIMAKLLDNGNLVVRDNRSNDQDLIWQSFDYPCDTLLSGMKLGKDLVTGREWSLTSWKSFNDPSPGLYTSGVVATGFPQIFDRRGSVVQLRVGPWNGVRFSSFPTKPNSIYTYEFVFNQKEIYLKYDLINSSFISRLYLGPEGNVMRWNWVDPTQGWFIYLAATVDMCSHYGLCGPYGSCNLNNSPACSCMEGFEPRRPEEWNVANWSSGCERKTPLNCGNKDGFWKMSSVKLPDTQHSWYNLNMSLGECELACKRNCSCTAYANLDIRRGGSGCLLWFGDLIDVNENNENQDLYIRVAASELTDETRSSMLNWTHRFHIINGIARGLLYLHQDSHLRIIHRDLKAANILLDNDMTPKISDFGLARRFKGYETGANTKNVVGTYGYIPPEYAVHGVFSVKSDVFSFGVLVLEIVSGMKNRGFSCQEHGDSLLGHAWRFYKDNKTLELVDARLRDSCITSEVLRSIHIGLLCVQNHAEDRPTMPSVVLMLGNEGVLPQPKQPAFFTESELNPAAPTIGSFSVNNVTVTLEAR